MKTEPEPPPARIARCSEVGGADSPTPEPSGIGTDRGQRIGVGRLARSAYELQRREPMLVAAFVLYLCFAVTTPVFPTLGNAENILRQTAPILLLGLGITMVVLVGGIDLSVGSVVLASATAAGVVLVNGLPSVVAMLAAVGVGAGVGAANAGMIEALRISPVIVTLGSMIAVRGLA